MSVQGSIPRLACAAAATLLAAAGLVATTPASAAASVSHDPFLGLTGNSQLTADELAGLGYATVSGPYDPTSTLTVGVTLTRPDAAGENAYLASVYDPSSPDYRQFLSIAAWQQEFGVSQQRYDAAVAWLEAGGLTVTQQPVGTQYIVASGPASAVETLFGVTINNYVYQNTDFYANANAPTVPNDLGVLDVAGLQNYAHMTPLTVIHQKLIAAGLEPASSDGPDIIGPTTNIGSTTPQDLWSIYDEPDSDQGQGEQMAIFGDGCTEPADDTADNGAACANTDLIGNLRSDETQFGLPPIPILINHYGSAAECDDITDTSGTGEWELDMPASTGMAPLAQDEHLYFGCNGNDPDILAAYAAWDNDPNAPRQGSSSFAGCEASPATGDFPYGGPANPTPQPTTGLIIGEPNQDAYEALLKEAVELGHTMFNSAGDLGANGCAWDTNTALNGVDPSGMALNNYPSSSNWVTTVGGTVLYWNGSCGTGMTHTTGCATRAQEYSWNYTGGGTSLFISAPPWQQATSFHTQLQSAPGVTYQCTTNWEAPPNTGTYAPGTFCRGLPDVAAQSGDIISNGYFAGGGTSLSSPLWLGMWTRIQAASSNPGRLGFAAPAIYANNANVTNYERDFFDIGGTAPVYNPTVPNDDTQPNCSANAFLPPYDCSGSGWDFESGWGTPDITNLMKDLDNGNTSPVAYVAPVSATPEAPLTALLPVVGLAGAVAIGVRRRRTSRRV